MLDRDAFSRLVGPVDDIMRNAAYIGITDDKEAMGTG